MPETKARFAPKALAIAPGATPLEPSKLAAEEHPLERELIVTAPGPQ